MEKTYLLVQTSRINQTIKTHLDGFFDTGDTKTLDSKSFLYRIEPYEESLPHSDIVHLLYTDFDIKIKMVVLTDKHLEFIELNKVHQTLKKMPYDIFSIEEILKQLIIHENQSQFLKQSFGKVLNHSDILTLNTYATANLNAVKAAKQLYLHRNSLNYRLETIKDKTGIDVKSFAGVLVFYLLFRP